MKILLDNGHGINTDGKRSPIWKDGSQLFEYEFNRDIVRRIADKLDSVCVNYAIITPELNDVSISSRIRRVNEYCSRETCLLISVHANAGKGSGWECWTSPGKTKSDFYAEFFYDAAKKYLPEWKLRKDYSDGDSDWESDFSIITKSNCPAILTENLFMDTEKDCKFIMSDKGREAIANLHVAAILNIINYEITH